MAHCNLFGAMCAIIINVVAVLKFRLPNFECINANILKGEHLQAAKTLSRLSSGYALFAMINTLLVMGDDKRIDKPVYKSI